MSVDIQTPSSKGLEEAIDSLGATAIGIADELAGARRQLRIATETIHGLMQDGIHLDRAIALMQAGGVTYDAAVHTFKRLYLMEILARNRGNQCKAAAEMGIHRNTIRRMIAELAIDPKPWLLKQASDEYERAEIARETDGAA